jgi:cytochrome c biogenesis protein CcmG/thiol:disulfide interchange protein DsbE
MRKLALAIALVVVAGAVYYGTQHAGARRAQRPEAASSGVKAPALTLVDLDGKQIETTGYAGRVVLVNFWAAWCTPCTDEVPKLVALQDKYRSQGLQVIGISMDDRDNALREFYRKNHMNYPVVAGNEKIAEAYGGILGLPTSFLIGRDGTLRAKHPGLVDISQLEQEVVALLKQ